jgi:hypothetical protein
VNASALPAAARHRALALMGVEVWVPRARGPALREALPEPAPARPEPRRAAGPTTDRGSAGAPRVVFATGTGGGFDGPNRLLLEHLVIALGLRLADVTCGEPHAGAACVCFGAAPGDAPDAVLAPPLATLRASARARRALWVDLRQLARRLRG